MTLGRDERNEMSRLYMKKAHDALRAAKTNVIEFPDVAVSRAYYSMFYAAQSLLVLHGIEGLHRHEGVNNKFAEFFVKTGKVPKEIFKTMGRLEQYRYKADYDPSATFESEDIEKYIHNSEIFINTVEEIINRE